MHARLRLRLAIDSTAGPCGVGASHALAVLASFSVGFRHCTSCRNWSVTPRKHGIEVVQFRPGERKDDVMAERLKRFEGAEGVVFIGKAQEKTAVFRTEKRHSPNGRSYPWIVRSSALVNHYYIYAVDRDFGPFFPKFSSYFPCNSKLCLNGHEYAKQQLAREGIAFEALDNGVQACADRPRTARTSTSVAPTRSS